jgi:DNA repair protein RadC
MSTLESLTLAEPLFRDRVRRGRSHKAIAQELQQQCPSLRGLSTKSVCRFCSNNGIHRSSRLSTHEVDSVVEQYVARVSPSYGRRTLTGLLRFEGITVGE